MENKRRAEQPAREGYEPSSLEGLTGWELPEEPEPKGVKFGEVIIRVVVAVIVVWGFMGFQQFIFE